MRVLMISDVYFPRVNGVSTSIAAFRQELMAQGHQVTLIVPDYPGAEPEPGVHRIPSRYLFVDPEDRIMRAAPVRALTEQLRGEGYDIVHIQTPFIAHALGMRLAKDLSLPVVETYHTYFEEYLYCYLPWLPKSVLRYAARLVTRRQCNRLDAVVVPSTAMAEVLRGYGVKTPMEIIPTGINLDQFQTGDGARFRARYGIPADRPVMLYVGRAAFEKNIGFLLQVVAEVRKVIPDILLLIAGEGPALKWLQRETDKLDLERNVMFVGYLHRDGELQDCYRAADLFTFASRTETQGLVLLEAMALGVPVVSTAIMGTRDVLCDGEGAKVVTEDKVEFAAEVTRLLQDPARRNELAVGARTYAVEWAAAPMTGRLVDFYRVTAVAYARKCECATALT